MAEDRKDRQRPFQLTNEGQRRAVNYIMDLHPARRDDNSRKKLVAFMYDEEQKCIVEAYTRKPISSTLDPPEPDNL